MHSVQSDSLLIFGTYSLGGEDGFHAIFFLYKCLTEIDTILILYT